MKEEPEYKVLIVDDEKHIIDVLLLYLKRFASSKFIIKSALDGPEALTMFTKFKPHICILDVNLPTLSGIELLKEFRIMDPLCKIIMLSGDTTPSKIINALRYGAMDYLEKPLGYDEFAKVLIKTINDYKNLIKSRHYHDFLETRIHEKFEHVSALMYSIMSSISKIGELKDPYTAGHMTNVSYLAKLIGRELKLTSVEIKYLHIGGILHDIGKIAIPVEILNKPSKLSVNEFNLIKEHSQHGFDIVKDIPFNLLYDYDISKIILNHHERLDGSGYPNGISGNEIDDLVRIMSIADVIESVSSMRPYRKALGLDTALQIIEDGKGTHFDAEIVDAVKSIICRYKSMQEILDEEIQFYELEHGL